MTKNKIKGMNMKTIAKGCVVVLIALSATSCGMMASQRTNFTDFLAAGVTSGNGMYMTLGDARGIEAMSSYQNGMITSSKIDSADQKANPFWTVEGKKADQNNKIESQNNKIREMQMRMSELANALRDGRD